MSRLAFVVVAAAIIPTNSRAEIPADPAAYIRENYSKQAHRIPMRDGVHLYTIVYAPKDESASYPLLLNRTPYGIFPYEQDIFRSSLGPNPHFLMEKYIFVSQDVRGCFMSEGVFENMRPHNPKRKSVNDIDESTDTFDTIAWLIKNVPNNNGKAGLWGISYPGFYSSAGMIDAHPALKAVSPQAPIADWFFDDFFHHGAFFLPHAYHFFSRFGLPRPKPSMERNKAIEFPAKDGYRFFLELGALKNANKYFKNNIAYWNTMMEHPNYDDFWQARNILPHLKRVAPAVMTVGGWFDAEDLWGPLKTYQAIEKQNPGIFNVLVMGPWTHGGWSRNEKRIGSVSFGDSPDIFPTAIELPFFNHFLKGKGKHGLPEAYVFETGANGWRKFDRWPPPTVAKKAFYLHPGERLSTEPPLDDGEANDSFPSDPRKPVPFTAEITTGMSKEYMVEDQRFAARRPDVLLYQTGVLGKDLTLAGPLVAELHVATSGTDSDWIVKVVDEWPSGYQMLVRSEVLRGRFRNSYARPEPFEPDRSTKISLELQDVLHTFKKGHRLQVQIHSTWFPLVDRNPQKYVPNIFFAEDKDFIRTTNRVFRSKMYPSAVHAGVLPAAK